MYGTYSHNMDKKGRLFIPAKFREEMGEKLYVCRPINGKPCLSVYSDAEFHKLEEKVATLSMAKRDQLKEWFFPNVTEVTCDASGRIIVDAELRAYAGLEKNVKIVGMSNVAEIWDEERLAARQAKITAEDIAKLIEELDI